jgi:hypothetical protein
VSRLAWVIKNEKEYIIAWIRNGFLACHKSQNRRGSGDFLYTLCIRGAESVVPGFISSYDIRISLRRVF